METRVQHCCDNIKNKKLFTVLVILALVLIIGAITFKANRVLGSRYSYSMMNRGCAYQNPAPENQFIAPFDAAKKGEIAIIVEDINAAKINVASVAKQNGGEIFSTFVSYLSGNTKNGSVVVKVPADKFDASFSKLKVIGTQVVQESTENIPTINYAVPLAASAEQVSDKSDSKETADTKDQKETSDENLTKSAQPAFIPAQIQDKGYIKVIFVDYGKEKRNFSAAKMGIAGNVDFKQMTPFAISVKFLLLIILVSFMFIFSKRIMENLQKGSRNSENKTKPLPRLAEKRRTVHIVRQLPKSRPRVVQTKKKK